MTDFLTTIHQASTLKPKYIYKRADNFVNVAGYGVTVFERRLTLPDGSPNMEGRSVIVARVDGTEEMVECGSIATSYIIMADKVGG